MTPVEPADVVERLAEVRCRISATGVDPTKIAVVAVTKGFGVDAVRAAASVGLGDIGENYAPELLGKATEAAGLEPSPSWHFIGRLQRNKVRKLADVVTLWQSIDRVELGDELARRAPGARVLVQVNASGEATKGGCEPAQTGRLVASLRDRGLVVEGLMTVAPAGSGDGAARSFERVRGLADDLGLATCSMGMSDDYPAAVLAGSTMLRLGRALFGPRPRTADVQN